MANELIVIEKQLQMVEPQLHNALSGLMPSKRLIQTVLTSCERTPKLLRCTSQSILNGAMTFAVLGLPVDGATGQGFLLPFGTTAQAAIGYKGYNTLGARARLTISGAAVREDDHVFDYMLGDKAFVNHKPKLGSKARIIAFWAAAAAMDRPPIISILSIDEVLAIKAKSPAVKANADTPWNDPVIGFPAMGEKSAKRRLARSTPLIIDAPQFMMAARMEEAFDEQGRTAYATPERGLIVEGEFSHLAAREPSPTPTASQLLDSSPRPSSRTDSAADQAVPSQASEDTAAVPTYTAAEYVDLWDELLPDAKTKDDGALLHQRWNSQFEKDIRFKTFDGNKDDPRLLALVSRVSSKIAELKRNQ